MSIKNQLVTLIIATVVLASFFSALNGYRNSIKQLDFVFDQELISVAKFISGMLDSNNEFPSEISGELIYQVIQDNKLVSRSTSAPSQPIYSGDIGFGESTFFAKRWRTYSIVHGQDKIVVAHPIEARIKSAESVLFVTVTPLVISIPFIAFLVYYIIHRSLKSLIVLSNQLKQKSTDDLTKISINNPPIELAPVITRLNHLLVRLNESFEREKQLTANAAHELRTPISVLTLTAHNITRDFESNILSKQSILELSQNVERMAQVIEQMIALYRFTPEQFRVKKCTINLQTILQNVITNNFDDIEENQQIISLDSNDGWILGEEFALFTLFENLLRNAIKYSGKKSEIKVTIKSTNEKTIGIIEDSGTGIESSEYDKVFERFYRISTTSDRVKGSGLGLSIVKHIASLHEAEIVCKKSILGGLEIQLIFATTAAPRSQSIAE